MRSVQLQQPLHLIKKMATWNNAIKYKLKIRYRIITVIHFNNSIFTKFQSRFFNKNNIFKL